MEDVVKKNNNPWKGLQSYQETDVIYGRDEEIKALYTRILYNTQTVVYGKSGIGKSSIVNAGIIPRAKHDEMLPVSIRLAHTTKKEQTATAPYVEQIFYRIKEEAEKAGAILEELVSHTIEHEESLWELLHRFRLWKGDGDERKRLIPLLLFDQFEEIFTLEISSKRVELFFSELADLLNEIKPSYLTPNESDNSMKEVEQHEESETPKLRNVFSKIASRKRNTSPEYLEKSEFHLVVILREDFLSYLERYTAYIPVMKQNRFPLLPLNEEQAAKIIIEPVRDLIKLDVAEIIIQKVTGCKDFKLDGIPEIEVDAALLSLYMEQLYERKNETEKEITSDLVVQNDDIINKFYEDSIAGVSDETIEYLEDELITNANRRNNVARIDLLSGGVGEDDLDKLIDKKVLRQFSYDGDLRIEFIHDILCPIVNDRIEHRKQLAKEREKEKKRKEETKKKEEEAQRRIQEEERKRTEAEKKAREKERKNKMKIRNLIVLLISIICLSISTWLLWGYLAIWEYSEYYMSFTKRNGWPIGVGDELKVSDLQHTRIYYKLSRKGASPYNLNGEYRVFNKVEIYNSYGNKDSNKFISSPVVSLSGENNDENASAFSLLQQKVSSWKFESSTYSLVSKEIAYDINNQVLFCISYFQDETSSEEVVFDELKTPNAPNQLHQIWAVYMDSFGKPFSLRDNGADRMRISIDSLGREIKYMYYTQNGIPVTNKDNSYGCQLSYVGKNYLSSKTLLDPYGLPSQYININFFKYSEHDSYGRACKEEKGKISVNNGNIDIIQAINMEFSVNKTKQSVQKNDNKHTLQTTCFLKDNYGNDTLIIRMWIDSDELQCGIPAKERMLYDDLGRCISKEYLTAHNKPMTSVLDSNYSKREYIYGGIDNNQIIGEIKYGDNNMLKYSKKVYLENNKNRIDSIIVFNIEDSNNNYYKEIYEYEHLSNNLLTRYYLNRNNRPLCYHGIHKIIYKQQDVENDSIVSYYRVKKCYDDSLKLVNCISKKYGGAIDSCIYDYKGNMIGHVLFNNNYERIYSYIYKYDESGNIISKSVMGVDGTPIRYAKWDTDNLSYYKMVYVRDFKGDFAYLNGINEFGAFSYITDNNETYGKQYIPNETVIIDGIKYHIPITKDIYQELPLDFRVPLIHKTTPYDYGLKDGDVVVSINSELFLSNKKVWSQDYLNKFLHQLKMQGGFMTIARPIPSKQKYVRKDIPIEPNQLNVEIEIVYFTKEEMNMLDQIK